MVAKDYGQKEGVDCNEVFLYVVEYSSICVLLVIVVMPDLELERFDVNMAFLHGDLEDKICIHHLEGFVILVKEDYGYLLKKSLYSPK